MELIKPGTKIPFTRYRNIAIILSTMVNIVVLGVSIFQRANLGVDFAGGTIVQLKFQDKTAISEIRQRALETIRHGRAARIQDFGEPGSNEYLVRLEKPRLRSVRLSDK